MRMLAAVVCLAALAVSAAHAKDKPGNAQKAAIAAAKRGEKAERTGDLAAAFAAYDEAATKDPHNSEYLIHRELLRQGYSAQLLKEGRFAEALAVDPANGRAQIELNRASYRPPPPVALSPASRSTPADPDLTPPLVFEPKPVKQAWDLRGDTKALYLAVGAAYGIHFDFEDELQPVKTHFVFGESDFEHVITALGLVTKSFTAPLSPKSGIVAADLSTKHVQYERTMMQVFDVRELATPEAINEVANALRTLLEMRFVNVDLARKEIIIRDEKAKMMSAAEIIRAMCQGTAQVLIEFQIVTVAAAKTSQLGILPTQQYALASLATHLGKIGLPAPAKPTGAAIFGGGASLTAVTVPNAALEAVFSDSATRGLQTVIERSGDNQPATFTSGVRYPIVTAIVSYASQGTSGTNRTGGFPGNSVPSFTYVDLGLKVKVTPHIHGNGEITLALEATSSGLGSQNVSGNPTINNTELTTQMRLLDNQTVILAGMLSRTITNSIAGLPGIAGIPSLGLLGSQRNRENDNNELLILVTPHVVRLGASQTQVPRAIASPDHMIPVVR